MQVVSSCQHPAHGNKTVSVKAASTLKSSHKFYPFKNPPPEQCSDLINNGKVFLLTFSSGIISLMTPLGS